jgi:hypothetical protein
MDERKQPRETIEIEDDEARLERIRQAPQENIFSFPNYNL